MCIQIVSFAKIVRFLTHRPVIQALLYLIMLLINILYMHDVLIMLGYYWGLPAFNMTYMSNPVGMEGSKEDFVNSYKFCVLDYVDLESNEEVFE